jgi:hypothetical protein
MSSSLLKQALTDPTGASECRRASHGMTQLRQLGGVTRPSAEQKQKARYEDGRLTHLVGNGWIASSE